MKADFEQISGGKGYATKADFEANKALLNAWSQTMSPRVRINIEQYFQ